MRPDELRLSFFVGMFMLCLVLEKIRPLRRTTLPKQQRVLSNLMIAAIGFLTLRTFFLPMVIAVSQWTVEHQIGILPQLTLPQMLFIPLALLLLDYTHWVWHWLNHNVPFLWRFHNVHHVDMDMDVSTGSRFHFGELVFSTFFRSAQVILIGVDPLSLVIFEIATTLSSQFHHSNILLPAQLDRWLSFIFVTPRMHTIHHSIVLTETDSNYSTIFSVWDRVHRTHNLNVSADEVIIGVAPYRNPAELGLIKSLALPFTKQREWALPDGSVPKRLSIKE